VEHIRVKFGDPDCSGFWDIMWMNRRTDTQTMKTHRHGYQRLRICRSQRNTINRHATLTGRSWTTSCSHCS